MAGLNVSVRDLVSEPGESSWDSTDALIYSLGVGCGVNDLAFTTENSEGVAQQALPTMAAVLGRPGPGLWERLGDINWEKLVHAEQAISIERPIPPEGRISTVARLCGIYDKRSGALVEIEYLSCDAADGALIFSTKTSLFIRGEGGWGGERGTSIRPTMPDREPDHLVTLRTSNDQALIYRLSGDRNPLHSDPLFATRAGFEKPILHGLCTYGFTGRALVETVCGNDPARLVSMRCRFSSPVWPGDELTVKVWEVAHGEALFQTLRQGSSVAIDSGVCTYR